MQGTIPTPAYLPGTLHHSPASLGILQAIPHVAAVNSSPLPPAGFQRCNRHHPCTLSSAAWCERLPNFSILVITASSVTLKIYRVTKSLLSKHAGEKHIGGLIFYLPRNWKVTSLSNSRTFDLSHIANLFNLIP